ncbi:unnamed protein product [Tetraodon nigroviridis]|uniref:Leishmanolysin-like peptidase n=1 Tax=Tetraodon nigroviridis TaxID=99883 RepID=Q4RE85_TETNG|nr:unnamed protein product [Tetraodon nigroviridis]
MESRLSGDGKPSTSWSLGPALVFSVLAVIVSCHGPCKHRVPSPSEVVHQVYLKPERLTKRSSSSEPQLKIKIIYDYSVDRQCVTNQYLRKRDDPHRYCQGACAQVTRCGPVVVPQHHLQQCKVCSESGRSCGPSGPPDGPGVEGADFVLYVSGLTTERCGQENIVAYAAYCQLEAELDRPIAGYANLCPAMISSQPQDFEGMLSTVKHEIIHALGFSAGLFAFYHDEEGRPLTPRFASGLPAFNETLGLYQWSEAVIRRVSRLWDVRGGQMVRHHVHVFVTPHVVVTHAHTHMRSHTHTHTHTQAHTHILVPCCQEEARRHFGCPILEGMELENQGGTGTELNHWEKRLLEVRAPFICSSSAPLPSRVSSLACGLPERGHDGLPHAEPGLLPPDAGPPGGQRLVPGQLQPGPEAGLGPQPGLRLRPEELQVLDGAAASQVRGQRLDLLLEPAPHGCVCACVCACRHHAVAPYCDTVRASPLQLTCRQDQLAVAVCNLQKHPEQLPPEFQVEKNQNRTAGPAGFCSHARTRVCVCVCVGALQYFDRIPDVADSQLPFFGGAVEIADFCPFSQEFSWHLGGEFQRSSFCRLAQNQPDLLRNYGAEQYGPDSVCLYQRSAFVMEQCTRRLTYPDWGSGCYKVLLMPTASLGAPAATLTGSLFSRCRARVEAWWCLFRTAPSCASTKGSC